MLKELCDGFLLLVVVLCVVAGIGVSLIVTWTLNPFLFALVVLFCLALLGSMFL